MDSLSRDRNADMLPSGSSPLPWLDVAIAARTSLPVLISAPPELALGMAIEIAAGTSSSGADGLVLITASDNGDLRSALMPSDDYGSVRTVVLRDVDVFDDAQQSALVGLLADPACDVACAWRVIATTSVPLFDRVMDGSFDERLFYFLNAIHIVA